MDSVFQSVHHDKYPFIDPSNGPLKDSAKGKTVLVTGASRGIGKRVAEYFALAGATTLVLTARREAPLLAAKSSIASLSPHCTVHIHPLDVSHPPSVSALFASLQSPTGPGLPHILVNNVGACASIAPLVSSDPTTWFADFTTNVLGSYLLCHFYLAALSGRPGVIINTSSGACVNIAPGFSGYGASKAAINRLTEYIDAEHAAQGVRCIAYHPGGIGATDMGMTAPAWLKPYLVDTVELAAGTCLYLAGERAEYLGGRYVSANWDLEAVEGASEKIVRDDLLKMKVGL